jgi:hypothetical protein
MMKNKSTLAKLLAEEDIFVVHKQMETAYFNSKSRELGLPIWKDEEMTKDVYDLLIGHEVGHALWTSLEMLEEARSRGINHGFVNILEDARIEKLAVRKYPGLVGVFKRGYADLVKRDFFGTSDRPLDSFGLIDRINLFYKTGDTSIPFSDVELPLVEKVGKTKTPSDVLDLAEEIYKFMGENPESDGESLDIPDSLAAEGFGDDDETDESEGFGSDNSMPADTDETNDSTADGENGAGDGDDTDDDDASGGDTAADDDAGDEELDGAGGSDDTEADDEDDPTNGEDKSSSPEGGKNSTGKGAPPVAETDTASDKGMDALRDKSAGDRAYARIPKIDLKRVVVDNKTLTNEFKGHYLIKKEKDSLYWDRTLEEVVALKNDSKKTVAYMVKEFEMKKAADQYARAATSKTGSLDMAKLHTYKYNEDLFKKVTTLPGATNHGMVMVLDWSGSMYDNLIGTLAQLYNLIWFCRRTKIPFEVFAFSDVYDSDTGNVNSGFANDFKAGDIALRKFHLLNFFSSNLTVAEEMDMMHILWMYSHHYGYRDWSKDGFPYGVPTNLRLGGTPLNEAIIAMMDLVPKFKSDTGVQKVNTIFLTDGAGSRLDGVYDYYFDADKNEHHENIDNCLLRIGLSKTQQAIITDPVTNKTYETKTSVDTDVLLPILKNRVPGMNVVGFFIAGSGKSGRVDKNTLYYLLNGSLSRSEIMAKVKFLNKEKYLAITQLGYDEYYVLPGGNALKTENETLDDDLVGAGKAKLKSAFGKMSKGKLASRQLLNKFVGMVA